MSVMLLSENDFTTILHVLRLPMRDNSGRWYAWKFMGIGVTCVDLVDSWAKMNAHIYNAKYGKTEAPPLPPRSERAYLRDRDDVFIRIRGVKLLDSLSYQLEETVSDDVEEERSRIVEQIEWVRTIIALDALEMTTEWSKEAEENARLESIA